MKKYKFNINAANYTFKQMLSIAGFEKSIIDSCICESQGELISFTLYNTSILFKNPGSNILDHLLNEKIIFCNIKSYDKKRDVPAIITPGLDIFENREKSILINADFLPISFILLSRVEEFLFSKKDKFDRFEFTSSLSYKYNLIDIPLVDEYALILRDIIVAKTGIKYETRKSKLILTQDLDYIYRFTNIFKSLASITRELLYKKSFKTSFNSIISFFNSIFNYKNDPYLYGIKKILHKVDDLDIEIQLYFMTYYLINKNYKYTNILNEIYSSIKKSKRSINIGIHPSLDTYNDCIKFESEINIFKSYFKYTPQFIRQHYLQIDISQTFDYMDKSLIKVDSTLGYAEREGFRCGTSHLYHPYNFNEDCAYLILEQPLIVMDTTLSDYRSLNTTAALNNMIKLFNATRAVNGRFVILWHNNNVTQNKFFCDNVLFKFIEYYETQKLSNS